MVDKILPEVRPVQGGGGSLKHRCSRGMAGVEMIHHNRTERPWDDWSVMEHDDWAHSGETAAVEKIIKD